MPRQNWLVASDCLLPLFGATNLDTLIEAVFQSLRGAVPCDLMSAFYRSSGNGLLKQRDSRGRESTPAFMRRYMELTPALPVALANPGVKILTTRTHLLRPTERLRQSAFYREIMQVEGWRHGVALCFWGDPPAESPVFVTSVYRREGRADFSSREIASLEHVYPFIDCAVNRVSEREAANTLRDGMAMAVGDGSRGFAMLDPNLVLVQANAVARRLCAAWISDGASSTRRGAATRWKLPMALSAACSELQHEWQALLRSNPDATDLRRTSHVPHPSVPGLTASITIVCPSSTGIAEPTFLIAFDAPEPTATIDSADRSAPILKKMTTAERAVAMVLSEGFSNQEIAERLGKSVGAVKFLLHRIYQKGGIPSRAALVAALLAQRL